MRLTNSTRRTNPGKSYALLAAFLGGLSIPVQANDMGFVVSHIEFALSDGAEAAAACPDGMSQSYQDRGEGYIGMPEVEQKADESDRDFYRRVRELIESNDVKNLCQNPELGAPSPTFHAVSGDGISAFGIDMGY